MTLNAMWLTIEGTSLESRSGGLRALAEDQIGGEILDMVTEEISNCQTMKILVAVMVQAAVDRDYEYFGDDFKIHCKLLRLDPKVVKKMFEAAWGCEDKGMWKRPDDDKIEDGCYD